MQNPISTDEVSLATTKMTNNRAADHINMCAELVKYAPKDIHTEIANTLNDLIEKQHQIDIGKGILVPLEKPLKRMPGPAKNLRPIILLPIIRKILSKITLSRLKPKLDHYLSASQSAYRSNRSTTDIVWSYRWILAKVQIYDIEVFSTGIDMSAAFDTIDRVQLIKILGNFADSDEMRMVRLLLSETSLEVKLSGHKTKPPQFASNVGSPQGDGLSGPLFTA